MEKSKRGRVIERFHWLDDLRLAAWEDVENGVYMKFSYDESHCQGRVPLKARCYAQGRWATYLLGADQVGTIKVVADMQGQVIQHITYDSFGNILRQDGLDLFLPIGFAGGVLDRHTGFVRFVYRDYDPATGRFTAPDPLGDTGGDHDPWEYCVDDPVNAIDPWGLKSEKTEEDQSPKRETMGDPIPYDKIFWTYKPKPGACEKCQAMKGVYFEEKPGPVHPNCMCEIVSVRAADLPYDRNRIIVPPGVDLEANIAEARSVSKEIEKNHTNIPWAYKYIHIYKNFNTGERYDYKQLGKQYEPFGNYHYGLYTKAMGINESFARVAAGAIQIMSGTSDWEYWESNFDDPNDQYNIKKGQDMIDIFKIN